MHRFRIIAALLLLSFIVLGCDKQLGEGFTVGAGVTYCEVSGVVIDESGAPLSGIEIFHDPAQMIFLSPKAESSSDGSFCSKERYNIMPSSYVITLYFIDPRWFDGVSEESYAPAKVRVKVVYDRNEMDSYFYVEEEPLTVVMSKNGDEKTEKEDYSWYLKLAGRQ